MFRPAAFSRAAALVLTAFALSSPAHAASGYDLTDQWWTPSEPGWGIDLVQQRDVIVAAIFVQGGDGRPAWYTAALQFQGLAPQTHEMSYLGDLYETTGPAFWSVPYGGGLNRKVGTMSIVAPTMTTATLTYSVDGVAATKAIQRYSFRLEQYDGSYDGTHSVTWSKCDNPAEDGTRTVPTDYRFALAGMQMTVTASDANKTCTYSGPYTQAGRLGRMESTYQCSNGEVGAMTFEEMNVQRFALMGRLFGANNHGCHIEGRFAAVGP